MYVLHTTTIIIFLHIQKCTNVNKCASSRIYHSQLNAFCAFSLQSIGMSIFIDCFESIVHVLNQHTFSGKSRIQEVTYLSP